MANRRAYFPVFAAVAVLLAAQLVAQSSDASRHGFLHRKAGHRTAIPATGSGRGTASELEFRSYEQMTLEDRDLAADGEAAIAERAGFAGLEFNQGKWSYQQIVGPVFPKHLFLQFTRNGGEGGRSMFSASIPRGVEGRVRIVPIERRGYSLFSPAPINRLTITAFNRIRREEQATEPADWLAMGLCYAALAGGRPVAAPLAGADLKADDKPAPPAELIELEDGGAEIHIADVAAPARPMLWSLLFDNQGALVKALHTPASTGRVAAERSRPVNAEGRTQNPKDTASKTTAPDAGNQNGRLLDPKPVDIAGKPLNPKPVDVSGKPLDPKPVDANGRPIP